MKKFAIFIGISLFINSLTIDHLYAQYDPPHSDCCYHIFSVGANLGWASSLLDFTIERQRWEAADRLIVDNIIRASQHLEGSHEHCSRYNPAWTDWKSRQDWLIGQAGRLRSQPTPIVRSQIASSIGDTLQWGKALRVQKIDGHIFEADTCEEPYFLAGFLLSYAQQSFRISDEWRLSGRDDWLTPVAGAIDGLESELQILSHLARVSPVTGSCIILGDLQRPISEIIQQGRRLSSDPDALVTMISSLDLVWNVMQGRMRSECVAAPQVVNGQPNPGWCILRRPDVYQPPVPNPPVCFEFYLADANKNFQRMATIQTGQCFVTSYAFRQNWQVDPNGGPFANRWEAEQVLTGLQRSGGDFYGCIQNLPPPDGGGGQIEEPIYIRVYNVDDKATVSINGVEIITERYRGDSEWVEVNKYLRRGINEIRLEVFNGSQGGWTYGFQVRINGRLVVDDKCGEVGKVGCNNDDQSRGKVYDRVYRVDAD